MNRLTMARRAAAHLRADERRKPLAGLAHFLDEACELSFVVRQYVGMKVPGVFENVNRVAGPGHREPACAKQGFIHIPGIAVVIDDPHNGWYLHAPNAIHAMPSLRIECRPQ
jgi:hypothetical protein